MNLRHPASLYNEVRHHAFSLFHSNVDINLDNIFTILNKYHEDLPLNAKSGLLTELKFYKKYRKKYRLTPTLDCGDKADFVGMIGKKMGRIDVTSSLTYKKFNDYKKPIVVSEENYFLILANKEGILDDIISLNVPILTETGEKRNFIDLVILMPPDYDNDGCSKYNPYQDIITVDIRNNNIIRKETITDWYIEDFGTFISNMPTDIEEEEYLRKIKKHGSDTARFLSETYGFNIMGCLSYEYQILSPDGDGEYGYFFRWVHPLFEKLGYKYMDEFFSEDLS